MEDWKIKQRIKEIRELERQERIKEKQKRLTPKQRLKKLQEAQDYRIYWGLERV